MLVPDEDDWLLEKSRKHCRRRSRNRAGSTGVTSGGADAMASKHERYGPRHEEAQSVQRRAVALAQAKTDFEDERRLGHTVRQKVPASGMGGSGEYRRRLPRSNHKGTKSWRVPSKISVPPLWISRTRPGWVELGPCSVESCQSGLMRAKFGSQIWSHSRRLRLRIHTALWKRCCCCCCGCRAGFSRR